MASEWNQIIGTVKAIGVWDILDIVIVAVLIYQVIKLIRETRAMQLAKGLILLLLLYFVAYNLNMKTVRIYHAERGGNRCSGSGYCIPAGAASNAGTRCADKA